MDLARASESDFHSFIGDGQLRRAGEWLVLRYADEVLALCAAMVRDRQSAEDLTQDVFQRAFAALAAFRGDASTRTWLLQIARNRCIDHLRARKRDPWREPDELGEPDGHPDDAPLPHDLILRRADVEDALSELTEGERALVVLRFKNGLEYAELAEAFGLREGTVRMRLSRALAKMREILRAKDATPVTAAMELDEENVFRSGIAKAPPPPPRQLPPAPMAARSRSTGAAPAPGGAPPPPPQHTPPPAAPLRAPEEQDMGARTQAGVAKPGFLGRMLAAVWGDRQASRKMPPDHPLSRYFLATHDERDDRVVEQLVRDARSL
jgi:RNA polymerase sigma-70 factor (ECF subfamily)